SLNELQQERYKSRNYRVVYRLDMLIAYKIHQEQKRELPQLSIGSYLSWYNNYVFGGVSSLAVRVAFEKNVYFVNLLKRGLEKNKDNQRKQMIAECLEYVLSCKKVGRFTDLKKLEINESLENVFNHII